MLLKRIYSPEEEKERAKKALELNGRCDVNINVNISSE
jgi:hypothetical protein